MLYMCVYLKDIVSGVCTIDVTFHYVDHPE